MYTALVHTWYEEAAVNTAGFYWEEGHRYYKVVESDVPGWQDSDAKYVMDRVSCQGKVGVVIEYDLIVLDPKWEVVRKILQDNHLNYQMFGCSQAGYIQY